MKKHWNIGVVLLITFLSLVYGIDLYVLQLLKDDSLFLLLYTLLTFLLMNLMFAPLYVGTCLYYINKIRYNAFLCNVRINSSDQIRPALLTAWHML